MIFSENRYALLPDHALCGDAETSGDPVEDEFVGERRIVRVSLRHRCLLAGEDLEGHVPALGLQFVAQFPHALRLEPAALSGGNQHGTFDVSSNPAQPVPAEAAGAALSQAVFQERPLVQVPDAAVANRCDEPVVEGDSPRHKDEPHPSARIATRCSSTSSLVTR
jgi:hypothetical protein